MNIALRGFQDQGHRITNIDGVPGQSARPKCPASMTARKPGRPQHSTGWARPVNQRPVIAQGVTSQGVTSQGIDSQGLSAEAFAKLLRDIRRLIQMRVDP